VILAGDGGSASTWRTGQAARVQVELDCGTTGDEEKLRLELRLPDGSFAAVDSTRDSSVRVDELRGRQVVEYVVPRVLLSPGGYELSVVLVGPARREIDRVAEGIPLEVVVGDLSYHGGRLLLGGDWRAAEPPRAAP